MAFGELKVTKRTRDTTYKIDYLDYGGSVYSTQTEVANQTVGEQKAANFNKTTNFTPGVFSVNPIEHLSWTGTSIPIEYKDRPFLASKYGPRPYSLNDKGGRKVYGHIAAHLSQYAGTGLQPFTAAVQPPSHLAEWALTNAYAELGKADFDTALWLAELRESVEMLRSPFQGFRKMWQKMFATSKRNASYFSYRKFLDDMSSQWLEYRYGIMPIILDIQNIVDLIDRGFAKRERTIQRGRKGKQFGETQTAALDKRFDRPAHSVYVEYTVQRFLSESISGSVYFRHSGTAWDTLQKLGVDPFKASTLLWELKTLSFVVDWVIGIGDWLDSITVNPFIDVLGNSISYRYKEINIISTRRAIFDPNVRYTWVPMKSQHVAVRESVVRLVNQPKPWLPSMEPNVLNLKRSLDTLSLLWGNVASPKLRKLAKATTKLR